MFNELITSQIHVRIFDAQVNCTSLNLTSTRYTGTETYVLITTTNIDYLLNIKIKLISNFSHINPMQQ